MSADVDRAVAGRLGEAEEQALFGALAEVSVQVADRYDQWVKSGSDESRRAAVSVGLSILPLLERLRAHHQGRLDKAQADIIREDGNPETLYNERWWQLDRGFSLAAAGQLSWLHYRLAMLHPGQTDKRKAWLEKSQREFSEFIGASDEKMRLESLLGRGMAARELGDRANAEGDLALVLQQAKGTSLYWPARMAIAESRAGAGGPAALDETRKLLAEAQSAGLGADTMKQIRLLRLDALLATMASGGGGESVTREAASLAAQLSAQGPAYSQRVTQMTLARLKDPRPVLGATVSAEWIAAENLAAAEKFEAAAKAYENIARSTDAAARTHADEVHHRLGVCYFRLGRYADAERELRAYLSAAPTGPLSAEASYLQFRAAEGVFRASPNAETRSSFLAVAENFTKNHPDHESRYEGLFRYAELLQGDHRYLEAADAYAQVEGPPAFRLRAAAGEVQCVADVLSTSDDLAAERAAELRARSEAAWLRFDKLASSSSSPGTPASADLRARTTMARALAAGSGAGSDAATALALLEDFEKRFPEQDDLVLPATALRVAAATALDRREVADASTRALAAMPGAEANYFDLVEKLSRALLRRSADAAPNDPEGSRAWAAMATLLLDRMLAAGRPIPDEVRLNLAQSYVEQERLADAARLYGEMLAAQPESRSLLRASALLAERRDEAGQAAGLWERLARLQEVATPAWYEARLAAASALAAAGQRERACANAREADGFRPDLRDAAMKKRFADLVAQACAPAPG
ncbi:MAG: hypothetical protein ABR538_03435 [Candidatus Binatia bacterium]